MAIAPRLVVAAALLIAPAPFALADDVPPPPPPPPQQPSPPPPQEQPPPGDELATPATAPTSEPRPRSRATTQRHARRDEPPPPSSVSTTAPMPATPSAPGLTLPEGNILLALTVESSVGSGDAMFAPVSFAPDLSYGATSDLTLSLVHSYAALTGFRGASGAGVCMSGEENKCRSVYSDVGVEGLYSLTRGAVQLAANGGVLVTSVDPWHTDLKLGAKTKLVAPGGRLYALSSPSVWYALDDRGNRVVPHDHMLWVPVSAWAKATPNFACGVASGIKGPLEELGDKYSIPLGAAIQGTIDSGVVLGASFVFGKVWGGAEVPDPGWDARSVHVWLSVQRDAAVPIRAN